MKLQMVVSCHVDAGNWTCVLWKSSQLLATEPSLWSILGFKTFLKICLFYAWVFCLHVSVYMCVLTQNRRRYHTLDPWSYKSPCRCWESNQGSPARAVNVLLTAEPSLSPTSSFLIANRYEFRCLRLSNLLAQLVKALATKLFIQSGTTAHGHI